MHAIFDQGPPLPCPGNFNMAEHTLGHGLTPGRAALEILDPGGAAIRHFTFAALEDAVLRTGSALLASGLRPGHRLALDTGNDVAFPLAFFGAVAVGIIPVPLPAGLTVAERQSLARDLKPQASLTRGSNPGLPGRRIAFDALRRDLTAAAYERGEPDRPAYMIYTSGTSGRPRGVVHAHRAAWARRMMWDGWYGLTPRDRVLHTGAFNWSYTLGAGLTDPWAIGATALVVRGQAARGDWPGIVGAASPTIIASVPGLYRQILASGADLSPLRSLRHGLTAGEALPVSVRRDWEAATGTRLYEALGMSECSTYLSEFPGGESGLHPQTGRRVAILGDGSSAAHLGETGRIAIHRRDPGLMLGYWREGEPPELPLEGEWFVTSDRAAMEGSGRITFQGRASDMLNAGGFRVSALEIESAFAGLPGLGEIAAVEIRPKEDATLLACALVGEAVTAESLAAHAAETLAPHKRPRLFRAVAALPRTANGKLRRDEIRASLEAALREEGAR